MTQIQVFLFLEGQLISQLLSFDVIVQATSSITTFYGELLIAVEASADLRLIQFEQLYSIAFTTIVQPSIYADIIAALQTVWDDGWCLYSVTLFTILKFI